MWDSAQNVAGQFLDSSDGFTFEKATSVVLTVQTSLVSPGSSCDYDGYAAAANAAAAAMGYAPDSYGFR